MTRGEGKKSEKEQSEAKRDRKRPARGKLSCTPRGRAGRKSQASKPSWQSSASAVNPKRGAATNLIRRENGAWDHKLLYEVVKTPQDAERESQSPSGVQKRMGSKLILSRELRHIRLLRTLQSPKQMQEMIHEHA